MPLTHPRPSSAGFTLLETVVALALLGMTLTSMGSLIVLARRSLETSLVADHARRQAQALVEVFQGLPDGHPWLASGVVLEPAMAPGFRLEGAVVPWPGVDGLQMIEVRAGWRALAGRRGTYGLKAVRRDGGRP